MIKRGKTEIKKLVKTVVDDNKSEADIAEKLNIFTELKSRETEPVKFIYHLADIHIRNYDRHDEYKLIFEKLYKKLKNSEKGIIIIAGDILHQKTHLTAESFKYLWDFFDKLTDIMPTIVIPGNHDGNINNDV